MNGLTLLGKELTRIFKDKKLLIPIIAILFVPLIYAGLFLWSFLDPYSKMDELPVAVVNTDQGAMMDGTNLELGINLVDNLIDSDAFDFHVVSEEDAMEGLDDLSYYMVIKIPQDFSENATTLLDAKPKKLALQYISNDSYNFLASQIGETAIGKIQATMSDEVSKSYAETIFSKIGDMADGMKEASSGSTKLNEGAIDLDEGAKELQNNLEVLAAKSIEFEDGMQQAQSGSTDLASGSGELSSGLDQLTDASEKLLDGSKSLNSGTSSLASGIQDASHGANTLQEKLPLLIAGTDDVTNGLNEFQEKLPKELAANISEQLTGNSGSMEAGINQLNTGIAKGLTDELAPQLTEALAQGTAEKVATMMDQSQQQQLKDLDDLLTSYGVENKDAILAAVKANAQTKTAIKESLYSSLQPAFAEGINTGVQTSIQDINNGFNQYQEAVNEQLQAANMEKQIATAVNPAFTKLSEGLSQVSEGELGVQGGVNQLSSGLNQLDTGATEIRNGQQDLVANMELFTNKLQNASLGAHQLLNGSQELSAGMEQLNTGATQFADGSEKLADGSAQLSDGMDELQDGTNELASKLGDAEEEVGSIHTNEDTYDMLVSPVDLNIEHANKVQNYGTGFAPYFISLGLFVGALLLTIIFPLHDPAGIPKNGFSWFMSKIGVMALVGVIQAILTDIIVLVGLNIEVQSIPLFFLFTIITSLTFVTIIQFLVTLGGNPGRFVAIIVLILQLTSSAGTFPLEVIPKAVQFFNPLLPMTYSVQGFKAAISSGDYAFMWHNVEILATYILGSIIITSGYFIWKHKKQFQNDKAHANQGIA